MFLFCGGIDRWHFYFVECLSYCGSLFLSGIAKVKTFTFFCSPPYQANDYTVEVSQKPGLYEGVDTMALRLLSQQKAHERFKTYTAPSISQNWPPVSSLCFKFSSDKFILLTIEHILPRWSPVIPLITWLPGKKKKNINANWIVKWCWHEGLYTEQNACLQLLQNGQLFDLLKCKLWEFYFIRKTSPLNKCTIHLSPLFTVVIRFSIDYAYKKCCCFMIFNVLPV